MRIVWKDTPNGKREPFTYRGYTVEWYIGGWIINVPGDDNIYRSHYHAQNAIDKYLGGYGQMGSAKRKGYGIQIVGKKNNVG